MTFTTDRTEPGPNDPIRQIPRTGVTLDPRSPDQHSYNVDRLQAYTHADKASRRKGVTDLQRAQMVAASKLAGIQFTIIRGIADDKDAENLRDDLVALWRIVDPLVEAFGAYAKEHFNGVDLEDFEGQLQGALDGNATFNLDDIASSIREERDEIASAPAGLDKALALGVD